MVACGGQCSGYWQYLVRFGTCEIQCGLAIESSLGVLPMLVLVLLFIVLLCFYIVLLLYHLVSWCCCFVVM